MPPSIAPKIPWTFFLPFLFLRIVTFLAPSTKEKIVFWTTWSVERIEIGFLRSASLKDWAIIEGEKILTVENMVETPSPFFANDEFSHGV